LLVDISMDSGGEGKLTIVTEGSTTASADDDDEEPLLD
jgi:hypothetical protein